MTLSARVSLSKDIQGTSASRIVAFVEYRGLQRFRRPRMFRHSDYWPFMIGVFTLGGIVVVPLIWSQFSDLTYRQALAGSLIGCGVFAYAHTRYGEFKIERLLLAMGVVFLLVLRDSALRQGGTQFFLPGGVLGFLVMSASGWAGIWLARVTGFSGPSQQPSPAGDQQASRTIGEETRTVGEEIRRMRKASGLTLEELASRSGISTKALVDMELDRPVHAGMNFDRVMEQLRQAGATSDYLSGSVTGHSDSAVRAGASQAEVRDDGSPSPHDRGVK